MHKGRWHKPRGPAVERRRRAAGLAHCGRAAAALTLIASIAYSTWKRRPSGLRCGREQERMIRLRGLPPAGPGCWHRTHENVLTPRSYSDRVRNMLEPSLPPFSLVSLLRGVRAPDSRAKSNRAQRRAIWGARGRGVPHATALPAAPPMSPRHLWEWPTLGMAKRGNFCKNEEMLCELRFSKKS